MTTVITTDIELDHNPTTQTIANDEPLVNSSTSPKLDDVAEASRIVDAGVPEGGYGWIALAACGILCFWFGACSSSDNPSLVRI